MATADQSKHNTFTAVWADSGVGSTDSEHDSKLAVWGSSHYHHRVGSPRRPSEWQWCNGPVMASKRTSETWEDYHDWDHMHYYSVLLIRWEFFIKCMYLHNVHNMQVNPHKCRHTHTHTTPNISTVGHLLKPPSRYTHTHATHSVWLYRQQDTSSAVWPATANRAVTKGIHWTHLICLISLSNDNCWLSCLTVPVSHSGQEKDGQLHSTWYHLVDIHICPNRSFPLKDRSACSPFGHGCAWITDRRVTSTTHAHYQVPSLFNGLC